MYIYVYTKWYIYTYAAIHYFVKLVYEQQFILKSFYLNKIS